MKHKPHPRVDLLSQVVDESNGYHVSGIISRRAASEARDLLKKYSRSALTHCELAILYLLGE